VALSGACLACEKSDILMVEVRQSHAAPCRQPGQVWRQQWPQATAGERSKPSASPPWFPVPQHPCPSLCPSRELVHCCAPCQPVLRNSRASLRGKGNARQRGSPLTQVPACEEALGEGHNRPKANRGRPGLQQGRPSPPLCASPPPPPTPPHPNLSRQKWPMSLGFKAEPSSEGRGQINEGSHSMP